MTSQRWSLAALIRMILTARSECAAVKELFGSSQTALPEQSTEALDKSIENLEKGLPTMEEMGTLWSDPRYRESSSGKAVHACRSILSAFQELKSKANAWQVSHTSHAKLQAQYSRPRGA